MHDIETSSSHCWEKLMFTRHTSTVFRGLGRRSACPLVAAALCAALVTATSATAHAETADDADTVGDMVVYDGDPVPAPDRTLNDVSNTTLTHGGRRVTIRVVYVDLKKKAGGLGQSHLIHMVTNEGVRRHLDLVAGRGNWSGNTQMYNGRHASMDCSVRHSINYEANVIKVSFPRRCVSKPRWIVFKVRSAVETSEGVFADDALRDRPTTADHKRLKPSDRVRRGSAHSVQTTGCVTIREFRRAHSEIRRWRVHRIFDTNGKLFGESDDAGSSRWYKQCRPPPGYSECRAVVDYYVGKHGAARVAGQSWAIWWLLA